MFNMVMFLRDVDTGISGYYWETYVGGERESEQKEDDAQHHHSKEFVVAQLHEAVHERRGDRFDKHELRVHAQGEQHQEKQDGPQRRNRQLRHGIRVHDKGQGGSGFCDVLDRHTHQLGEGAQVGENDEARKDTGCTVADSYSYSVPG